MASQQYGLGRGLASLIPPKKSNGAIQEKDDKQAKESPFQAPTVSTNSFFANDASVVVPPIKTPSEEKRETSVPLEVSTTKIVPNPHQPRMHFDEEKLDELTRSIKEHGILQPLVVSPARESNGEKKEGGRYELIAGERRLQAAKRAGLETVPTIVRDVSEQEKLELAIIENVQRHNLNPIEEAKAYLRLLDEFGMQQDAVAKKMGKSRSTIANTLRLLHLPVEIQRAVMEGKISEGHARALLAIENPEKQRAIFDLIIKEELTVRETELKVRSVSVKPHVRSSVVISPEIVERAEQLTQILGTKVKISPSGKGGKLIVEYYSSEDLDNLFRRLEQ
ncbi:MAG: ParB/RepB/Spo0J family partition protein [Candidatus Moranbacteria bacterium]|nr:ParB/RepB/Spo0J family partition protein [Candidatus Moranbacteria bacterium]